MTPFIADFHIHSHYSRATSKDLDFAHLDYWARLKGIKVVGTGDFTHPAWLQEMKDKLVPAEPARRHGSGQGLFRLKDEYRLPTGIKALDAPEREPRFILTSEISNIYKKFDKVRKVHNVIFAPDLDTVERIQAELTRLKFNIISDGRPILGMDSRDLLELCLTASPHIFFVPAHIWTPWFSVLGSKSGFDSIEECFGDLSGHIHAVETGLSSDVPMNYLCTFLDRFTLISNSDAHSPEKLGRNANLLTCDLSYPAIIDAMTTGDPSTFRGTIDLFPQEGKYHYDGHRKCGVCWNPVETRRHGGTCPKCGKEVTVGVMNRVVQLADRADWQERPRPLPFHQIITLKDLLSEILGVGPTSKKVGTAYDALLQKSGAELDILLHLPPEDLHNDVLAEAIRRMRNHEIYIQEGYDGEYGQIKVFQDGEARNLLAGKNSLFAEMTQPARPPKRQLINFNLEEYLLLENQREYQAETPVMSKANPDQEAAIRHGAGPALVIAGPGTGKTRVLTHRIAHLIQEKNVDPATILAVTFTNKAATEMRQRVDKLLDTDLAESPDKPHPTVCTFHALGYTVLKNHAEKLGRTPDFSLIDPDDREWILTHEFGIPKSELSSTARYIGTIKIEPKAEDYFDIESDGVDVIELENPYGNIFERYDAYLRENNLFELDDLIYQTLNLFLQNPGIVAAYRQQFQWLLVDEYQDVNMAQFFLLLYLLDDATTNLFAIGDPNQAIYGFRGANVKLINRFDAQFKNAVTYRLKTSYRCSDHILKAAHNVMADGKQLLAGLEAGVKLSIHEHPTASSEAEFVARTIEQLIGGLRFFSMDSDVTTGHDAVQIESLSEIAVLCRTRRQFEALEKAFHDHTIPVQTVGEASFFRREPMRSVVLILKLIHDPHNHFLQQKLGESAFNTEAVVELATTFADSPASPQSTLKTVVETFFDEEQQANPAVFKRASDLAAEYDHLADFLQFIDLGTGVDTWQPHIENVTLMTLHASKGLEFECVFITGCEEELLPYRLPNRQMDVDEERRLFYVGMTRAKKLLYLTHAQKRILRVKERQQKRSRFVNQIERELVDEMRSDYQRKEKPGERQISLF